MSFTGGKSVSFWSHFKLRKRLFSSCTKSEWLNIHTAPEKLVNNFFQQDQNKSRVWMSVSSNDHREDPGVKNDHWEDPGVKNSLDTNIRVVTDTGLLHSCGLKSLIYLWQICVVQIPVRKKGNLFFLNPQCYWFEMQRGVGKWGLDFTL